MDKEHPGQGQPGQRQQPGQGGQQNPGQGHERPGQGGQQNPGQGQPDKDRQPGGGRSEPNR
jgi:translation initiation factor IF-2